MSKRAKTSREVRIMSDASATKKKLGKKPKIALGVFAMLVALALCAGIISKYSKTLVTEGTVDLAPEPAALTEIPKSGDEIVEYIKRIMAKAEDNSRVSVDVSTSLSVDENSITADGGDSQLNIIKFAKRTVLEKLTEKYPCIDGTFGDGFADYPQIALNPSDFKTLSITNGRLNDMGEAEEDDYYFFNLLLPDFDYPVNSASPVFTTFGMDEIDGIIAAAKSETAEMLTVKSADVACTGFAVDGRIDKFTDNLDYICFTRAYTVTLNVEFIGDYSGFDVTEITFPYCVTEKYDYTWAGFSFAEDKLTLFERESEMMPVSAVIADDATAQDYELTFTSSNENVAVVDSEGNVKGVAVSTEPAIITAVFKYMGNTYTDTCEVYVTVPVARIIASPASLSLAVGASAQVGYDISPDDATIKSVLWFTEDESVAVIDERGNVTGVGVGTVKVYAVTVDGGFRSSCTVTVTDN